MSLQAAPDYFELSDYMSVLRRRWRTIAVWAASASCSPALPRGAQTYTATVLVQVNALPNNANAVGGRTGGPVNMDNEGQAVQSAAVVRSSGRRIHSPLSVADLVEKNIHVTVPPNCTYLQITSTRRAPSPRSSARTRPGGPTCTSGGSARQVLTAGIRALQAQATQLRATVERLKTLLFDAGTRKASRPHHRCWSATRCS